MHMAVTIVQIQSAGKIQRECLKIAAEDIFMTFRATKAALTARFLHCVCNFPAFSLFFFCTYEVLKCKITLRNRVLGCKKLD